MKRDGSSIHQHALDQIEQDPAAKRNTMKTNQGRQSRRLNPAHREIESETAEHRHHKYGCHPHKEAAF